ncbi:MAG TPA: carboxypeptidase-like regulatory domain-containing protein [Bryobacteraceae bacterium]|nr:carboxypeptidase-like regulatory domain-containing protein [Bryobacteraceae bacterium]
MRNIIILLAWSVAVAHSAVIRGVVLEHSTGRPLARAEVRISSVGARGAGGAVTTRANSSGLFFVSGLAPGGYLLSAVRKGFAVLRYGQKTWKAAGTPIILPEQDSSFVAELRLRRLGAITGAVLDENQVGLPDQQVFAYQATRPPRLITKAKTDDRGIYRIGELLPGRYYVRTRGGGLEEDPSPAPTFFKESASVDEAIPVEVELDGQASDVNIQPPFQKLYRLSGSAQIARQAFTGLSVELMSDMGPVGGSVDSSGGFVYEQLSPGTYELRAEAISRTGMKLGGYQKLTLESDLSDVSLPLGPFIDMHFEFADPQGSHVDGTGSKVSARRVDLAGKGPVRPLRPEDDELPPGPWEISVTPPAKRYVVSISRSGHDDMPKLADGWKEFLIAGNFLAVRVGLSPSPAALHGIVMASADQPAIGAPVFLKPADADTGAGLTGPRITTADMSGRYHFTGLPPGNYLVFSSFDFQTLDDVEVPAAATTTVSLKEGVESRQDLDLFAAP